MGLSVGLVCKSLLGKAHTVMAEGGVAAALGYVEPKDNWKVHFRDTMKGGRYLNQWRMAQLHAMEAPDRVKELEEWGALFDRTADGRILQRNFGGHKYPRLAHVGDRTGLEMIRTLQQHGIHCRDARLHGVHGHAPPRRRRPRERARSATGARTGRFVVFQAKSIVLATGGIGRAFKHQLELVGVHGRRAGARLPRGRGAHGHGVHAVSPDGDGLAAERARHAHHRRGARRGRDAAEQGRQAHHVRLHPRALRERDGDHRGRGRPVAAREHVGRRRRRRGARRISCRATSWRARSTAR